MRKKHLIARFNELDEQHPDWGLLPILRLAVLETKPSQLMIRRTFNKYIPKDDYGKEDKGEILRDLYSASALK